MPRPCVPASPFRYFNSSPEVIRLALRRDGLIEIDRKTLMILDPKRLCEVAEFNPAYLNPGAGVSTWHPLIA